MVLKDIAQQGGNSFDDFMQLISGWWLTAQTKLIKPEPPPAFQTEAQKEKFMQESVKRGFDLFVKPGPASCISCHTDFGRQSEYKYDAWGTIVRPVDFTRGIFHGGRRPIDLFWRIHSGIKGAGMTAFSTSLKDSDIWDIVNFLQMVPYPNMLKKYDIQLEAK
jgi:YD repeat-containing protein